MTVLQNLRSEIKSNGAAHPLTGHGPATNVIKFQRLVDRVHRLGPKPVSELLIELVGNDEQVRNDLLLLLERYGRLSPAVVEALGADRFSPTVFAVTDT